MSPRISPRSSAARSFASYAGTRMCARSDTGFSRKRRCRRSPRRGGATCTAGWPRLEELYDEALDDHLERLAHYHAQGGNQARAVEYLERAAARAEDVGGNRAAELAERARTLGERRG